MGSVGVGGAECSSVSENGVGVEADDPLRDGFVHFLEGRHVLCGDGLVPDSVEAVQQRLQIGVAESGVFLQERGPPRIEPDGQHGETEGVGR